MPSSMMTHDKHVRFTDVNTYYSPTLTPPPSPPQPAPSSQIISVKKRQLSRGPSVGRLIHMALLYDPHNPPILAYDVMDPPESAQLPAHSSHSSIHDLDAAWTDHAFDPPVSALTLVTDQLPFHIPVIPMFGAEAGLSVTVHDVLWALYRALRMPVSAAEYAALPAADVASITGAYHKRYMRLQDPRQREIERRKGMKRVDFLKRSTKFMGLIATKRPDRWFVEFA